MTKEDLIRVAIFRPGAEPTFEEIQNELKPMQELVGGYIKTLDIGDGLIAVLNEEGKIERLEFNRTVVGPQGYDDLVGTFFVVRSAGEEFASISAWDEALLKAWRPPRRPGGTP